jgi:hypothetical protein
MRMTGWVPGFFAFVALTAGRRIRRVPRPDLVRAPVVIDGRILAHVRGITGHSAVERAAAIEERIAAAARDSSLDPARCTSRNPDDVSRIQVGDDLLMGVFDADAALEKMDRQALAQIQARVIRDAIERLPR